ncbi:hypothetical protein ANCCEY_06426 [Ancylostoma ceylanicum]|nr:hypothetical protein ANCCEY_06426 [Ancylostoma ceylanicum]EYC39370.1 hypothetical protein Y032_0659g1260 [Ancylostoma ceylanicum]
MVLFVTLALVVFCSSSLASAPKGYESALKGCDGHDATLAVIRGPISLELFKQHPELHNMDYSCKLEKRVHEAIGQSNPQDYLERKYEGEYNWYFEYEEPKSDQSDDFFKNAVKSWEERYNTVNHVGIPVYQPYGFGCAGVLKGPNSKVACVFGAKL